MNEILQGKRKVLLKKMERMRQDDERNLPRMDSEIARVRQHANDRGAHAALDELERRKADYVGLGDFAMTAVQKELDEVNTAIRAEEENTRAQGRAELDTLKTQARDRWLDAGGDDDGFNISWQDMEREILKQKAMPTADASRTHA